MSPVSLLLLAKIFKYEYATRPVAAVMDPILHGDDVNYPYRRREVCPFPYKKVVVVDDNNIIPNYKLGMNEYCRYQLNLYISHEKESNPVYTVYNIKDPGFKCRGSYG